MWCLCPWSGEPQAHFTPRVGSEAVLHATGFGASGAAPSLREPAPIPAWRLGRTARDSTAKVVCLAAPVEAVGGDLKIFKALLRAHGLILQANTEIKEIQPKADLCAHQAGFCDSLAREHSISSCWHLFFI